MSVSNDVQEFIHASLAQNNKALLDQISNLEADLAFKYLAFQRGSC